MIRSVAKHFFIIFNVQLPPHFLVAPLWDMSRSFMAACMTMTKIQALVEEHPEAQ